MIVIKVWTPARGRSRVRRYKIEQSVKLYKANIYYGRLPCTVVNVRQSFLPPHYNTFTAYMSEGRNAGARLYAGVLSRHGHICSDELLKKFTSNRPESFHAGGRALYKEKVRVYGGDRERRNVAGEETDISRERESDRETGRKRVGKSFSRGENSPPTGGIRTYKYDIKVYVYMSWILFPRVRV